MNESLMEWEVPLERRSEKDKPHKSGCETAGKVEKKLIREFLMGKCDDGQEGLKLTVWEFLNIFSELLQHQMQTLEKNVDCEVPSYFFQDYPNYLVNR